MGHPQPYSLRPPENKMPCLQKEKKKKTNEQTKRRKQKGRFQSSGLRMQTDKAKTDIYTMARKAWDCFLMGEEWGKVTTGLKGG